MNSGINYHRSIECDTFFFCFHTTKHVMNKRLGLTDNDKYYGNGQMTYDKFISIVHYIEAYFTAYSIDQTAKNANGFKITGSTQVGEFLPFLEKGLTPN